ncbi:MAG: hypothetical protein B7Z66_09395 [Chromatiales bacterium 21-64-14]|nr:MAG: hypothetical protein B7Z66_09395 [Chromatiales bacterium 21-64-14]HQU16178.1 hypothetical protein [Gammaproteobacteria bacterium]
MMRWADVDLDGGKWRYTASKTRTEHLVPLAPQVVKILGDLRPLTAHQTWVFLGQWMKVYFKYSDTLTP